MPGDNKEIKLSFSIDEQSVSRARQVIRDITSDLERLNRAGGTGFFGGGGGGGNMVGATGTSSTASPSQTQNQKTIAKMPSMTQPLAQTFIAHKNVFESMAKDSKQSMKMMTDGLREAVKEQKRLIEDLAKEAAKLGSEYESVQGGIGSVGKSGFRRLSPSEQARRSAELVAQRLKNEAATQKARTDLATLEGMGGSAPGGGLKTPTRGGLAGLASVGTGALMGLGISPAMLGVGAGAMVAAWGARSAYTIARDWNVQPGRVDAANANVFARRNLELLGGNTRNTAVMQEILADPIHGERWRSQGSGWRRNLAGIKALIGSPGEFFEDPSSAIERRIRESQEELISNLRTARPVEDQILESASQGAQNTVSTLRGLGYGASASKWNFNRLQQLRRRFSTWTDGDIGSAFGSVESTGLFGARFSSSGFNMHRVLAGQAAGYRGIGGMMGTAMKYAGADGANIFGNLIMGAGIDPTAASAIGSFTASAMDQLGMVAGTGANFGGQGLMARLMTGVAGDSTGRLTAEQNIKGMQGYHASLTGRTSPWRQARNIMLAIDAAPGLGTYAHSMLANEMSIVELMDAAEGKGDAAEMWKALGGDQRQISRYVQAHNKTLLEGVSREGFGQNSNARKLLEAMDMAGMGYREFARSPGASSLGMSVEQMDAAYATALWAGGEADSRSSALGMARTVRGGGSADVKTGSGGKVDIGYELRQLRVTAENNAKSTEEINRKIPDRVQSTHNAPESFVTPFSPLNDPSLRGYIEQVPNRHLLDNEALLHEARRLKAQADGKSWFVGSEDNLPAGAREKRAKRAKTNGTVK